MDDGSTSASRAEAFPAGDSSTSIGDAGDEVEDASGARERYGGRLPRVGLVGSRLVLLSQLDMRDLPGTILVIEEGAEAEEEYCYKEEYLVC